MSNTPEERIRSLALEALHHLAHIVTTTDKDVVDRRKEKLEDAMIRLGALTREPVDDAMADITRLCEKHKEMIDNGLAEEMQAVLIIVEVRSEEEFQELMGEMQAHAQQQHAQDIGGEVQGDPSGKVDPNVLEGLPTEIAN